jgi:acyl-CoA synthetase (AMP-forming)/AMP-acid ligase II
VQSKFLSLVQRAAKDVGLSDDHIYVLEGDVKGRRSFDEMIHHVRKKFTSRLAVRPVKQDTLAYLVFSSGTSGLPKAVMISHGNLNFTMMQLVALGMAKAQINTSSPLSVPEPNPVVLGFLPLHHSFGLNAFCFQLFFSRKTLVLMPKWNKDVAHKLIPKYRVVHLSLIPSLVHQLVNSRKAEMTDLSTLRSLGCGAAYLPDGLKTDLLNMGPKNVELMEGYGLSEITLVAIGKPAVGVLGGRVKSVPGSAGILLPGVEARILREDGTETSFHEPGELWLKSGGVALGYKNNEEASRETFVEGWLKTGDRFLVDEDGTFFFQDRIKDTLKISGVQVSPVEIENVLLAHPDKLISDVTVVGVPGGRTMDEKIPRAWVVLSETGARKGQAAVVKALDAWSKDTLSKYKWLRGGIEVVNEIPKSPTGKVLRRVLQDEYIQRMKLNSKL